MRTKRKRTRTMRKQGNRPLATWFQQLRFNLMPKEYEYEPLKTKTSIRILKLQPGKKADRIECQLFVVERDQAPPYEAISYTWGWPTDHTYVISCGGRKLEISVNLRNALIKIRDPSEAKFLWADALCVNQSDKQERGQQVKQMGSIYANAERVLVWLGCYDFDGFEYSDRFNYDSLEMGQLPFVFLVTKFYSLLDRENSMPGSSSAAQFRPENLDNDTICVWTAFGKLLNRPWFERVWVVQEVDIEADFDDLIKVSTWLSSKGLLAEHFGVNTGHPHTFSIFPVRYKEIWGEAMAPGYPDFDFLEVLELTRSQQASDPRDYVYALLGHPSAPVMEPDYTKSASELFFEVAVRLIEDTQSLRILSAVRHGTCHDLEDEHPSWAPTWNREFGNGIAVSRYANASMSYDAAAGAPASWNLTASRRVLHVRGFVFDVINEYTSTKEYDKNHGSMMGQNSAEQWQIQAALRFSTRSTYTAMQRLSDIGCALTAGMRRDGSPLERTLRELPADFAAFRLYLIEHTSHQSDGLTTDLAPEGLAALREVAESGDVDAFVSDAHSVCFGRRLFSTRGGLLGLGPGVLRQGDLCCILFGARVPFILRPDGERYRLVGEAYVHGVMHGEAMVDWMLADKYEEQVFDIF